MDRGSKRAWVLDADPRIESANPPKGLDEDEPSLPGTAHPDPPITRSRNAIVPQVLLSLPLTSTTVPSKLTNFYTTQQQNNSTNETLLLSQPLRRRANNEAIARKRRRRRRRRNINSNNSLTKHKTLSRTSTQNTKQKFHGFG